MNLPTRAAPGAVQFAVKAVPRASRDRIVGLIGEALKVQVAAPAEGGKANARLREVLAKALGVPVRSVQVLAGHGNARKVVGVSGMTAEQLCARLGEATGR